MMYFCTYFDINYVPRALAMYDSLLRHCHDFQLFMLCFDDQSAKHIKSQNLQRATIITLDEFEAGDNRLVETKKNRTQLEYYYTCSPSLPLYVLNRFPQINLITYLDADLFFYSDPSPLLDELGGDSIGITVHNFPQFRSAPSTGKYNVGWLSFRRDQNGIECLTWWREKCLEWCYERFEDGKYADQLYLDKWPELFQAVKIFQNKGANVAAWNVMDYKIAIRDGRVYLSGDPLVFYHFHGFKQISKIIYNTNLGLTYRIPSTILKQKVFLPYIIKLRKYSLNISSTASIRVKRLRAKWIQVLRTSLRTIIGIVFRQYVIVVNDKIY
jgi:hypothetical protein